MNQPLQLFRHLQRSGTSACHSGIVLTGTTTSSSCSIQAMVAPPSLQRASFMASSFTTTIMQPASVASCTSSTLPTSPSLQPHERPVAKIRSRSVLLKPTPEQVHARHHARHELVVSSSAAVQPFMRPAACVHNASAAAAAAALRSCSPFAVISVSKHSWRRNATSSGTTAWSSTSAAAATSSCLRRTKSKVHVIAASARTTAGSRPPPPGLLARLPDNDDDGSGSQHCSSRSRGGSLRWQESYAKQKRGLIVPRAEGKKDGAEEIKDRAEENKGRAEGKGGRAGKAPLVAIPGVRDPIPLKVSRQVPGKVPVKYPESILPQRGPFVTREMFPAEFVFGTATAAYQVEGAAQEGGRGPSIWDVFSRREGKTHNGDTGDVACDQYHRFEEDVQLMAEMNVDAYRFSISWPRLFPSGKGPINMEGVAYYNALIDALLAKGITPYVTLFHWDLPAALQDEFGGFLSPKIVPLFRAYAAACFLHFGDRVSHWITLNEPLTFSTLGFATGEFAPGRCSDRKLCEEGDSGVEPYLVVHHLLLSHAEAVRCYREEFQAAQKGVIGITVDSEWAEPLTPAEEDKEAANRRIEFLLGWLLDPIFFGTYPPSMVQRVAARLPEFSTEDSNLIRGSADFVGLNHYTSRFLANQRAPPGNGDGPASFFTDQGVVATAERDGVPIGPQAASPWLYVVPWGISKLLRWIDRRYASPEIYITENGLDEDDDPSLSLEGALQDMHRVQFYNDYLYNISQAIKSGVKVKGYFAWSFMDNFEWQRGYSKRFGIHYVDYKNGLTRYPKWSAKWWQKFLSRKQR